jgi:hypothetical protein
MSGLREGDLEAAGPERVRALDNGRSRSAGVEPEADSRLDSRAISDTEVTPAAWATLLPAGRRGAGPAVRHSVARLQAGAGNAAVAGLLDGRTDARATRRVGPALRRSGNTDLEGGTPTGADRPEAAAQAEDAAPVDDEALPPPTSSFTKIGAPSYSAYTVSGTLRQAAEAIAGRPEAGQATAAPDLKAAVNDKGTRMVHAQVTVALAVLLPEWDGKASATPNQRAEWDRFKAAITAHEAAHVEIDKASFAGAHSKILAKKTLAESYAQYDTIVGEAKAANDTFDGDAHGRPATNINPNIDEVTKVP